MKKILYSLLTLAAALTVASCQKEQPVDLSEGHGVKASFGVTLGDAPTKAFADGTTVDKLYAALYEVDANGGSPVWKATASPVTIVEKKGTITFSGNLHLNKYYKVVFWAQKDPNGTAAGPYTMAWDPAPVLTINPEGAANDETRDAFYGVYETGKVSASITATDILLKRPFGQVNILVPVGNVADFTDGSLKSSMTVKNAPTKLNLLDGTTDAKNDYKFNLADMTEPAWGDYAETHKYFAMNYVLPAADGGYYTVEFTAQTSAQETGDTPKSLPNIPIKANVRTNIVGDVFSDAFGFSGTAVVTPGANEQVATIINVAVGTAGTTSEDPVSFENSNDGAKVVTLSASREITGETPTLSIEQLSEIIKAEWDAEAKGVKIKPVADNGRAIITVVFPEVTKATTYAAAELKIYVKVGSGTSGVVETPTFDPAAGEVASGTTVAISTATKGATIYYTTDGNDPTTSSTQYANPVEITAAVTLKAIAVKEGMTNSAVASAAYTIKTTTAKTLPYEETFLQSIGDFTTDEAVVEGSETKVWIQSTQYGMVATSYVILTEATAKSNNAAESWLTSPLIDLGSATAPAVSFEHATNYFTDVATAATEATVWVKEESATTWTQLAPTYPTSMSFTYVSSGEVDLTAYKGKKIQIAFKYTSTATKSGTWEIKNFKVEDASTPIETTVSVDDAEVEVGSTTKLSVTTNNTEGTKSFTSNNTSVATVDANGVVTGVAVGTATITTKIGAAGRYTEKSTTSTVTVVATGTQTKVSIDFTTTDAMPEGFPTSSSPAVTDGTYTINGYSFTIHASNNFYWGNNTNLKALLIGKADSYVLLPAIEGKKLVTVKFHTGTNASSKVTASINSADGETAVHTVTDALTKDTDYTWVLSNTAANTQYRFSITNANNFQFATLELVYE